jgi:hypothetical protein
MKGRCDPCPNRHILSILYEQCAAFDWVYDGDKQAAGYCIEPGYFTRIEDGAPVEIEDVLALSECHEHFCIVLTKEFGEYVRTALVSVRQYEEKTTFSVLYGDDVLSRRKIENYVFLNIAIGVSIELSLDRLHFSVFDGPRQPSVTEFRRRRQNTFGITDVSYIPDEYIDDPTTINDDLPDHAQLIRVQGGFIVLCCERLFCDRMRVVATADALGVDSPLRSQYKT